MLAIDSPTCILYPTIAAVLIFAERLFFKLASRYNILDIPKHWSSHTHPTIRGGGIIFPLAILLWFFLWGLQYPYFMAGLFFIALISFRDDLRPLPPSVRLPVHFFSLGLLLVEVQAFNLPWAWWLVIFLLAGAWINAFNFMDGINGITVFYALVFVGSCVWLNESTFVEPSLLYVSFIALSIFAFFNARKRARTFAGDVGSVSLGFIMAFLMILLIRETGHFSYLLFFGIYGVDAALTIVHRLLKRENIFRAHRTHLYQYLANELGWPHLWVAGVYAVVQLIINGLVWRLLNSGANDLTVLLGGLGLLAGAYVAIKYRVMTLVSSKIPEKI